ncbi:MAG: DUF5916 domain-containing protein [Candidatus Aminicenantes bacterium]|nr:DUF5916 domain-containing protein [Candidatus Aminicenantes bacterium]
MKKVYKLMLLLILPLGLLAGSPGPRVNAKYIPNPPHIDGNIDDVYETFEKVDRFYQSEPQWGQPGTEDTIAYFGYDEQNLYVAFKCLDKEAGKIRAKLVKRENIENSDTVTLYLDTFNTRQRAFIFGANPYGIQFDGTRDDESEEDDVDLSWDTLWYSKGKIYQWGYFVEIKIPFKSLRFPSGANKQEWGMAVERTIARKGEAVVSVPMSRDIRGYLSQAATLEIDREIKSKKYFELIPTSVSSVTKEDKFKTQLGATFKYGVNSNLTLDLTYNPDFSQIESDAGMIDINQRFAIEYPEKRPFFLESNTIFDMPLILFYSRRIAAPQWGIKLTGRTEKSNFGFISTRDDSSFEDLGDITEGGSDKATINVLRYMYRLKGASYIGVYASHKHWKDKNNLVLSTDSFLKFNNFAFMFQGAYSKTGPQDGNAVQAEFSYSNRKLFLTAAYKHYTTDFDAQVGFLRRIDYWTYWVMGGYTFYPEKEYLRNIGSRIMFTQNFDWKTGEMVDTELMFSLEGHSFKNSWFHLEIHPAQEKYAGILFDKLNFELDYEINLTRSFSIGAEFAFGDSVKYDERNPSLGFSYAGTLSSNLTLFNRVNSQITYTGYYFYHEPGGDLEMKMNIFRVKSITLFTRELSSRIIYEFNDFYTSHYLSLLLSYELNPGTVFYLGATSESRRELGKPQKDWSVFLKLSYLLRM